MSPENCPVPRLTIDADSVAVAVVETVDSFHGAEGCVENSYSL